MSITIEGRTALVTGSNRGIGRALVEALLDRGAAKVYATARDVSSLQGLVEAGGGRVVALGLDVTDAARVLEVAREASDVDLLFNNAGYAGAIDFGAGDAVLENARREFEVNYFGPLAVTQAFAPALADRSGATIVNVVSLGGLVNLPLLPTYSDSKAAVHSLTVGSRMLLGGKGIRVVGVYPGPVDTDMAKDIPMDKATPRGVADRILDGVAAGDEDIFPDAMAEGFRAPYAAGAKTLEATIVQMMQAS